jgi:hypothetical protein
MASTPVRAVVPAAKALRRRNAVRADSGSRCSPALSACGQSPRHLTRPVIIKTRMATTTPYVGTAKIRPDSFEPRRFARVTSAISPIVRATLCSATLGTAETIASPPAVIETATVRM